MKNFKLIMIAVCLMAWCIPHMSQAQQICGTDGVVNQLPNSNINFAKVKADRKKQIFDYLTNQANQSSLLNKGGGSQQTNAVFVMPTVVHIIHKGEAVGTGTNLSDATVIAAIANLNSRLANGNGNGVNLNVQLCLAARTPTNTATNGITRYDASVHPGFTTAGVNYSSGCGGADFAPIFNANYWSNQNYFNIFIFSDICGAAAAWQDYFGVYFKAVSFTPTLNGALMAHETGHYLGLDHVFAGDNGGTTCPVNTNCLTDGDGVCDTPPVMQGECTTSTCSGGNIVNSTANYLSYCFASWDRYTQGQKDRVTAALNSPPLNLLPVSLGCIPLTPVDAGISSLVNPTSTTYSTLCGGANYNTAPIVNLLNYGTSTLTSVSIKYKVDNNAPSTYTWTGSLAAFTSAQVTLPSVSIPQGAHTFQAYTTLPNGVTDGYNPNDSSIASVTITGPSAITATTSQTNTTCAGNNGAATVNPTGGTLVTNYSNLTNFETPHSWTIVNGSQPNKWCAGTAHYYQGANGLYLSNDNCATFSMTGSLYSTVHLYKDFTFPANASNIKIEFDWKNSSGQSCGGAVDSSDYIAAYAVPTSTTPVAGTVLASGKIGGKYSNTPSWTHSTITNLDANAGTSKRIVFTWSNDWCVWTPPAMDNINVSYTQTFTYAYLWSNGQTTQNASGLTPGIYTCTITDANGCTATKSVTILNGCTGVTITAGGPTTFCQGGSVVLTSSLATGNLWSTGATTQSITVTTSGSYSCTNGANTSNSIVVTVNPIPTTPAIINGGPTTFCQGGSVTLSSSSSSGNLWSTGATTQSINVTTSGNYAVTITQNGCTSSPSNTIVVTVNPIPSTPTITAGGATTFCQGGSVTLTSSSAIGNLWSTGATTQSISATASGNYTVAVTSNGCTSSPSIAKVVTVNSIPSTPTISASGPTTFCVGGSVTLTSSSASGNLWSTGSTNQSINATTSGNYTVAVTSNGCTSSPSAATTVTVQSCSISISANGPTTFCQGGSVLLSSSQPSGNLWSTGATTQNITVTTSGSYSCTNNGNTSNTIVVTVNPLPNATISASNGLTFCNGSSTVLSVPTPGGTTQTWTKDGFYFATAPNPLVTDAGIYGVTVTTSATGCTATSSVTISVYAPATPTISAGGPTTFCQGGSVTLTSSSASGNLWSTGATTQGITVTTSGNYTVAVTIGGCTSSPSAATTVTVQTCGSLTITAGGPTTFCSGGNVVLTSSIVSGNLWSNGATTQSITVTASGNYNCTNGGNTSNTIAVFVNASPSNAVNPNGTISVCSGSALNAVVTGNAANFDGVDDHITIQNHIVAATSFTAEAWVYWKGGANWQRIVNFGNGPNFYILLTTKNSVNGMPRFAINIGAGDQLVDGNTPFPINEWHHIAITLTGSAAKLYLDGNVIGTNASFAYNPTSLGATINNWIGRSDYVTDAYFNGYIDEMRFWNVARTQAQIQNNIYKTVSTTSSGLLAYYKLDEDSGTTVLESVSGNTTATANNGAIWQVPSSVPWNAIGYAWSNGASTQGINVTAPATYTVTVTAVSGCTAVSAPVVVSSVKPTTTVVITAGGSTTLCTGQTVALTATAKGNALLFDGSNDYAEVPNPMIPTSGSYSILFWAKETVAQGGFREIISQGRNFYIGRDNTGIIRVGDGWLNTGVAWPTDLQWHHYAVVRSGSNTYLYIDGNLAATKGSAIPSPIVVSGTPNNFVIGDQFAHGIGENFGGQVDEITIWSNQRTQAQIQALMSNPPNITASGLVAHYKLDEGTGSSAFDAVSNANAAILTNGPTWVVPSSIASNIASYLWSTTATTQSITVGTKSTYKVTVTNNAGCTSTATKKVYTSIPKATITVTGSLQLCGGSTVTFTASSGPGYTYQWTKNNINIGGATNQTYVANSAGTYKVIVTNSDGCTKLSGGKVVTVCARLGDVALTSAFNLSVYPNPTFDFIGISFDCEDVIADVQIMNADGAIVLKKQLTSDEGIYDELMDVSKFAPGMYMILVQTQHGLSTKRFVKQ